MHALSTTNKVSCRVFDRFDRARLDRGQRRWNCPARSTRSRSWVALLMLTERSCCMSDTLPAADEVLRARSRGRRLRPGRWFTSASERHRTPSQAQREHSCTVFRRSLRRSSAHMHASSGCIGRMTADGGGGTSCACEVLPRCVHLKAEARARDRCRSVVLTCRRHPSKAVFAVNA